MEAWVSVNKSIPNILETDHYTCQAGSRHLCGNVPHIFQVPTRALWFYKSVHASAVKYNTIVIGDLFYGTTAGI